jgi:ribosome production factor 2
MRDLATLKKPDCEFFSKKNEIRPFEDITPLELMAKKQDASLFAVGSHSKKRPDNLVLGRHFDGHLLDMFELGVKSYKALSDFRNEKVSSGSKPVLLFSGSAFESSPEMKRLRSLLIDFFRIGPPEVASVRLAGLEHAIQVTAYETTNSDGAKTTTVSFRSYRIELKKSSEAGVPRVELEEIGPSLDLVPRRSHLASDELFASACKRIKNVHKVKKVKNVKQDVFGTTLGLVHVPSQNISKVQTRKMKGLKEEKKAKKEAAKAEAVQKKEQQRKKLVESVFAEEPMDDNE